MTSRANRLVSLALRIAAGGMILVFLVYQTGTKALLEAAGRIEPVWILPVFVLLLGSLALGALNVFFLMRPFSSLSYPVTFRHYMNGWAMGLLVPAQVGDFAMVFLFKREGIDYGKACPAYVVDKAITFVLYLAISLWGVTLLLPGELSLGRVFVGLSLLGLLVSTAGFAVRVPVRSSLLQRLQRLLRSSIENGAILLRSNKSGICLDAVLTGVKIAVMVAAYWCSFRAFEVHVPLYPLFFYAILAGMLAYLPISLNGLGTVEWGALYLFGTVGVADAVTLSAYLLLRVLIYLIAAGTMAMLPSLRWGEGAGLASGNEGAREDR